MSEQTTLPDFTTSEEGRSTDASDGKPYQNEKWLREQYWDHERSTNDIANECGVSGVTILDWMDRHGIERRSQSEAQSEGNTEPLHDEDYLREQYYRKEKSLQQIADDHGTTPQTVKRRMEEHGIERRSISEAQAETDLSRLREDPDWLREQYHEQDRTLADIAEQEGTDANTVRRWLLKHGIETKSIAEAKTDGDIQRLNDPDWLRTQYHQNGLTTYEIAEIVGTSITPVLRRMNEYGIERRSPSAAQTNAEVEQLTESWLREQYHEKGHTLAEIGEMVGGTDTLVISAMERHGIETRTSAESQTEADLERLDDPDWLREQYHQRHRTLDTIAETVDCCQRTVVNYMEKHGIDRRSRIQDPDHLDHIVRSNWELEIATLLTEWGVEYEYESLVIRYGDGRRYEPDFVTDDYVIEVKGHLFGDRDEKRKAQIALDRLKNREYVVVGVELPADVHLEWAERERLRALLTE